MSASFDLTAPIHLVKGDDPVLVGDGTPHFSRGGGMRPLRLIETRTFGNGVVLLRHERDRDGAGSGTAG